MGSNGIGRPQAAQKTQAKATPSSNDFSFEFPKFGNLPVTNGSNNSATNKQQNQQSNQVRSLTLPTKTSVQKAQQTATRHSLSSASPQGQFQRYPPNSIGNSPMSNNYSVSPQPHLRNEHSLSADSLSGLFSPSILEASRSSALGYFPQTAASNNNLMNSQNARASFDNTLFGNVPGLYPHSSVSNTDSPDSSSESQQQISSIGTSPEPNLNSPGNKLNVDFGLNTISENQIPTTFGGKQDFCEWQATSSATDHIFAVYQSDESTTESAFDTSYDPNAFNWLAQQNGGGFDPVLFGDYRESQDNVLSQDFGSFFNDAYPLPDLGSPSHNFNEVIPAVAPKNDLAKQADVAQAAPARALGDYTDKPMSCNKIWLVSLLLRKTMRLILLSGIVCNQWRSSATAKSTSTTSAVSYVQRLGAPRAVPWSTAKTLTRFWALQDN